MRPEAARMPKLVLRFKLIGILLTVGITGTATLRSQTDNGIHVGQPKVYDSRELTLMLDNFSEQLRGKDFVDPKSLATALGNVQGFQNTDESASLFLNGAVGPGAASVFSGAGAAATSAPTTSTGSTTPTVTINVAPTLNAGAAANTTASTSATPATQLGPQAPALPSLQTAPNYTPTFGSNGSDLLSDEVNLTYQLYNVRMLLDRSLTDRLYNQGSRLEAVVGFDIDLEPDQSAHDAAAVVEVTVNMASCPDSSQDPASCDKGAAPSVVALMPEEGSHNAATLSQKANAFGGAIAASVYSVGFAAQKRSQVFYLYRDMDTVSFQKPTKDPRAVRFGWQFRPVLGRHSIEPGMRHMMVVLGLPSPDAKGVVGLSMSVSTHWERYYGKNQTTSIKGYWFRRLPGDGPPAEVTVNVPTTDYSQMNLGPKIEKVQWIPTDTGNGVAVVTGENFFPGTVVRLGNKTLKTTADGLIVKSDKEIEVEVPLSVAVAGGVLSGRYGQASSLQTSLADLKARGLVLERVTVLPQGNDMDEVVASALITPLKLGDTVDFAAVVRALNDPLVLLDGKPVPITPFFYADGKTLYNPNDPNDPTNGSQPVKIMTFVPSKEIAKVTPLITVMFPFDGPNWALRIPYYEPSVKVTRLGNDKKARLLMSATDPGYKLCTDWVVQLDSGVEVSIAKPLPIGTLKCVDDQNQVLSLEIAAKDLRAYHHLLLVNEPSKLRGGGEAPHPQPPLVADIPSPDPPPPGPFLDKDQKVTIAQFDVGPVKFTGKNLDQVKEVLFDKRSLRIVKQEAKQINISLSREVTGKASNVKLQLISDDNDPVIAELTITPASTPAKKGK